MTRHFYIVLCRVIAIFVFLDGLNQYMYTFIRLSEPIYGDETPLIGYMLDQPLLLWGLLPAVLWIILAIWLWKVPNIFLPETEEIAEANDAFLFSGIKLIGIYLLITMIPILISGLIAIPSGIEMMRYFTEVIIKIIIGSVFLFKTDWIYKKNTTK